jgi:hypothetical protein
VTVTDNVPSTLSVVSASGTGWNCAVNGQVVTCTRSAVAAGQTSPSIALRVIPSGNAVPSVTNTAGVQTAGDPNATNDSDSDTVNVVLPPANTKTVTNVYGTATIPGKISGLATVTFNVFRGLLGYQGTVRVVDPSANTDIRSPATVGGFNSVSRFGLNGAVGQSVLNDYRTTFTWTVDDLNVIGLGPDSVSINAPGYVNSGKVVTGDLTVLPR